MAVTTYVCAVAHVASQWGEDPDLLEAIVSNDDNLTYGSIVSVRIGPDDYITALTDDGICELKDMLTDARQSPEAWNNFLQDFVEDPDIIARVKDQPPR
jgi:glucose/arabinose dehydrogenase